MNNSNVLINKLIIILTQYRKFMQIKDIYIYIYLLIYILHINLLSINSLFINFNVYCTASF